MQAKIQKDIYPNIDTDTDMDAGGIAIALLHLSAGALKMARELTSSPERKPVTSL